MEKTKDEEEEDKSEISGKRIENNRQLEKAEEQKEMEKLMLIKEKTKRGK